MNNEERDTFGAANLKYGMEYILLTNIIFS